MPSYDFDTGALAKRYVMEVGSSWVQAVVAQQSDQMIYTSVLTQPDIVSALQRRVREGTLEAHQAQHLAQQVLEHMTQSYALAAIMPPVITQACALLQRHPLRAYDALHLACAMPVREVIEGQQLSIPVFVPADDALLAAAAAEGLAIDNPLQHS
jgi:predicted nucleic acid-binding protein